jgi:hypothetical protein
VQPPPGLERFSGGRQKDALRAVWKETKAVIADEHDADTEHRAVWISAMSAAIFARSGDALRERAVLETALESTTIEIYRAMIAARLARVAARGDALDLADAWLESAPKRTGLPEAESDLEVARALVAHRRGDLDAALSSVGPHPSTSAIVGGARVLAAALRIDILERRGEKVAAYKLWREALGTHGMRVVIAVAKQFELAPKTRGRSHGVALTALAACAALGGAIAWLLSHM